MIDFVKKIKLSIEVFVVSKVMEELWGWADVIMAVMYVLCFYLFLGNLLPWFASGVMLLLFLHILTLAQRGKKAWWHLQEIVFLLFMLIIPFAQLFFAIVGQVLIEISR